MLLLGFPGGADGKETTCQCRRHKRCRSDPWVRRIPWGKTWQPTPVFLPREPHGQRSLAGYRPWGCREPPWAMSSMTQSCTLPPVMPELVVAPQSQRTGCPSHRFPLGRCHCIGNGSFASHLGLHHTPNTSDLSHTLAISSHVSGSGHHSASIRPPQGTRPSAGSLLLWVSTVGREDTHAVATKIQPE